jgi:CelD/BcsL family acetyltransferase involved in cellulose biosynthesis
MQLIEDPVNDPRWSELLERHQAASVFHSPAWLEALRRTYGYEPVAITTSSDADVGDGLVACRIRAWSGSRLVSLPFSDHCQPLAAPMGVRRLVQQFVETAERRRWGAIEIRPRSTEESLDDVSRGDGLSAHRRYCLHDLDLRPALQTIFDGFHPSSIRRAVRRCEREGVTYDRGNSDDQLQAFFALLRLTRRRHGLPPQPMAWFRNLRATMGSRLAIHVARHQGHPIAALLTLSFKNTVVYKYGGSDAAAHPLGGMPFLFWQVIQAARAAGATNLDLGRSDLDRPGLIAFKEHLGATRSVLTYYQSPSRVPRLPGAPLMRRAAGRVVSLLPNTALDVAGRLLYRHFG